MRRISIFLFAISSTIFFFSVSPAPVSATSHCNAATKPPSNSSSSHDEYRCGGNRCGGSAEKRSCTESCAFTVTCNAGGQWVSTGGCTTSCGAGATIDSCGSLQVCNGTSGWSRTPSSCSCNHYTCDIGQNPSSSRTETWNEYLCTDNNACGSDLRTRSASQQCWDKYVEVCPGDTDADGCKINCEWQRQANSLPNRYNEHTTPCLQNAATPACQSFCKPVVYTPDPGSSPMGNLSQDCGAKKSSQRCQGPIAWTHQQGWPSAPENSCQCSGSCYPAPVLNPLDNSALDPKNVFDPSKKPKLPVNLGWSDVEPIVSQDSCAVNSYHYQVYEKTTGTKRADALELTELEDEVRACKLAPNAAYTWQVRACLDEQGTDCGAWGQKDAQENRAEFTTSPAPELLSPYDYDWENQTNSALPQLPVTLQWCKAPQANSYLLNLYQAKTPGAPSSEKKEILAMPFDANSTEYPDEKFWKILKKGVKYFWEIGGCNDTQGKNCNIFSQLWSFLPGNYQLTPPKLKQPFWNAGLSPPVVNASNELQWETDSFTQVSLIRLTNENSGEIVNYSVVLASQISFGEFWNFLQFDTIYTWKVAPCWGPAENQCQKNDRGEIVWSEQWKFKSTGAPPQNLRATPQEGGKIAIPFILKWDASEGAASYQYQISQDPSFVNDVLLAAQGALKTVLRNLDTEVLISPATPGETYYGRVATCADKDANLCAPTWTILTIPTKMPEAPVIVSPLPSSEVLTPNAELRWQKVFGANFYRYEVTYLVPALEETDALCKTGGVVVVQGITEALSTNFKPLCLGTYRAQVQSCVDGNCKTGGGTIAQEFTLKQSSSLPSFSIVPCGTAFNNPSTPWNEREPCQLKHLALLMRNIIDFVLWKLSLLIIIILAITTGVIFYFSFGGPDTLAQIKGIWKAVGVGALILLFAWTFLNLFLGILGFAVNIFGTWHELPL